MAIVHGYLHDMFVSYAHLDNEPLSSGQQGWVDMLVDRLQIEVRRRLGRKDFRIWIDHQIAVNRPLTSEILTAIEKSATLLVIMSPAYLKSEWCTRERNAFLGFVKDRLAKGCVFKVESLEISFEKTPVEFGELLPVRFWTKDPESGTDRTLGVPDVNESLYIKRLNLLSESVMKQLNMLLGSGTNVDNERGAQPVKEAGPFTFVAQATEDLEELEDGLRSYLRQAGINVLPQRLYPQSNPEVFEAAMRDDLNRSKVFVQLLSASSGREIDFAPGKRYPGFQHDVAAKSGKPMLLWRDRNLDVDSVKDAGQRALLESARACGIEEFKRAVVEEARREPQQPRPITPNVMVFVNADSPDRLLARDVGQALAQHGIECYWPLGTGSPEAIRKDLEQNLRTCDGIVLIYGAVGADWVRGQLRQSRKIMVQRDHPLRALAVFEAPPAEKAELEAAIPNLITLDCRKGIDTSVLKRFADTLWQ